MHVTPIPCLRDNYAYVVRAAGAREAVVVDACEAGPVVRELERQQLGLVAVLTTHHHWDHVGGNLALAERYPRLEILGHESERQRIPGLTTPLRGGESLQRAGLTWTVLHTPGHTLGALSFVASGSVFTGDTLFVAGCGRLFEGTAEQLYDSLERRLGGLPGATLVYPGHEYTVANLQFALSVEPRNAAVVRSLARARAARERGLPTLPSSIAQERETNPFLRCDLAATRQFVQARLEVGHVPSSICAGLRRLKDDA